MFFLTSEALGTDVWAVFRAENRWLTCKVVGWAVQSGEMVASDSPPLVGVPMIIPLPRCELVSLYDWIDEGTEVTFHDGKELAWEWLREMEGK